jgi:hypothetical protein
MEAVHPIKAILPYRDILHTNVILPYHGYPPHRDCWRPKAYATYPMYKLTSYSRVFTCPPYVGSYTINTTQYTYYTHNRDHPSFWGYPPHRGYPSIEGSSPEVPQGYIMKIYKVAKAFLNNFLARILGLWCLRSSPKLRTGCVAPCALVIL